MFPADHLENCEKMVKKYKKCTQIDVQAALMIDFQQLNCNGGHSNISLNLKIYFENEKLRRK
jgi:hypothetical protein